MLKIKPPDYLFCPFCGTILALRTQEGCEVKFCPRCKWVYYPHVASTATGIVVRNNQILLVQRARQPFQGKWMIPAGFLNYGEHPSECAMREVREETGYIPISSRYYDMLQVTDDTRPGSQGSFGFFYEVEIDSKSREQIIDIQENSAVEWFDLAHLPEIAWEAQRTILKRIIENKTETK